MPLPVLRPLLLACALALGTTAMTAAAQTPATQAGADATLLSVSARGQASRVPDVATASAGVVTQATDASAAMRANAEQMNRLMAAIRDAGVAAKDTRTTGISVNPEYRYAENRAPEITGYRASNTVSIKVRDIDKLGKVLDALVASGANDINGPAFEIDQPDAVYDEARRTALESARARASMYADALGLRVRRIVSISEGGGFQPPQPMMMKAAAMDSVSTPVSPGETTLDANLDVVFELGR